MWGSVIIQLMGLILSQVKHAVSTDEPPDPSIRKDNKFRPFKDHELNETTPLAVVTASSATDCAFLCSAVDKCGSFDYAHAHGPQHRCEINSGSKTTSPSKFVRKAGYTHYEKHYERPPPVCIAKGFSGNFTTLGGTGISGPSALSSHYDGKDQDGQITLDNGTQLWTVPQSAKYRIEAVGASGGYDIVTSSTFRGRGARIIGNVDLVKGEIIKILVGQEGQTNTKGTTAGGGGGSFVARATDTPLIVAGGGGGAFSLRERQEGCDANASTSGTRGFSSTSSTWPGGSDGQGATTSGRSRAGGGGGGFYSDGRSGINFGGTGAEGGEGGKGFVNGGVGGRQVTYEAAGGFGGGGGGFGFEGGAGGGGGYSGGASGIPVSSSCGGGGGSYNAGTDPTNECCFNGKGDGYVLIQQLECS